MRVQKQEIHLKGEAEEILSDEERSQDSCVPGVDSNEPELEPFRGSRKEACKR